FVSSKKAKGKRAKSRNLMTKKSPKATVNKLLKEIPIGAKVHVKLDPAIHSGLVALIFQGKTGEVIAKKGRCYVIALNKGNKKAEITINPAHLIIQEAKKEKIKIVKKIKKKNENKVKAKVKKE
ncbi:MAG: hypothetical protein JW703_05360, partial [Candidatus Diapherotrites archaeon]|nr:hypothetical protein [Candidatus Diapherotrites archaeon]